MSTSLGQAEAGLVPEELRERPAEVRGRFSLNLGASLGYFGLTVVIGAWYVPFLVRSLGPAAYGLIPLASTITSYMSLITLVLNSAVSRSLTIALEHSDHAKANRVFNTSLWGSVVLVLILLVPAGLGVAVLDHLIRIPPGYESEARWLFVGVMLAFLVNELKTPFDVSSWSRNRLDLRNLVNTGEVLVRVGLVVALFLAASARVHYVGWGILGGTLLSATGAIVLWRVLTPSLHLSLRAFDWTILKELTTTGAWVIVNQLGAILYLSIDLLVANRMFGAEAGGRYAAVLQLPLLIRTVGTTIGGVFSPTIVYYYARQDADGLLRYLRRAVKLAALMLALPIGLMCGFAEPLLRLWLGSGFAELDGLLVLMTFHLCINMAVNPLLGVQYAADRMKVPGLVTLGMGAANLALALILAGPAGWGLSGIAAAGAIMLTLKNLCFTPVYAAHVLQRSWLSFLPEFAISAAVTVVSVALSWLVARAWPIHGWDQLVLAGLGLSAVYIVGVYRFVLTPDERALLWRNCPVRFRPGTD